MCRHMYDWNIVNCDVKQLNGGYILDLNPRVPTGGGGGVNQITTADVQGCFSLDLRGRPFDSEGGGGGWHFRSGQIIYFHHMLGWKNFFPGKPRTEYFQPQQIFEKAKKKKKKKRTKRGLVRGFSRGGRTWFYMFCITFCRLLARDIAI